MPDRQDAGAPPTAGPPTAGPPTAGGPAFPGETPAHARMMTRRRRTIAGATAIGLLAIGGYAVARVLPDGSGDPQPANLPASVSNSPTPQPAGDSDARSGLAAKGQTRTPQDAAEAELGDVAMPQRVPRAGTGVTKVLTPPGEDSSRSGRNVRYTVEVEGGLGVPEEHFAATVREVLTSKRGWEIRDGVHFVNVAAARRAAGAETDVRIILGSPAYVDRNCLPLRTMGELSCHARGRVLLNVERWVHGAETYGADVVHYRQYLISHEVGHAIGHGHEPCPSPGALAPVMVQQTKSLSGCQPWPWPVRPPG